MAVTPEAAMRWYGAWAALTAASVLVFVLFVVSGTSKACVLAVHFVLQLGCCAVLLSPVHRAVAPLARRAAATTREFFDAQPAAARAGSELRWAGFACILLCGPYAARAVAAGPAAATEMSVDRIHAFFLFFMFLAGVWMVALSMLSGRALLAAVAELDGGEAGGAEA